MSFQPSPEQEAVFDSFLNGSDNIAIQALAGTGKTTTLIELAKRLPSGGTRMYTAFNKDIVSDVLPKLTGTGMQAKTFHSIGYGALRTRLKVSHKQMTTDGNKWRKIVEQVLNDSILFMDTLRRIAHEYDDPALAQEWFRDTVKMMGQLSNMMRLKMVAPDDSGELFRIVAQYGFDKTYEDEIVAAAVAEMPVIARRAYSQTFDEHIIDFTDMISEPIRLNAQFEKFDYVFTDECQDLSPLQRDIVRRIIKPDGRIVLVGDVNQAIYAFAGADDDSFDLSVEMFGAKVLPLTVTRRCSKTITKHAAHLVPEFKHLPDAPDGKLTYIYDSQLGTYAEPGDMVLCRLKAPLIEGCLELLKLDKPATILGSEIGGELVGLVEQLERKDGLSMENVNDRLHDHRRKVTDKMRAKLEEDRAELYKDLCSALSVLIEGYRKKSEFASIHGLKDYIGSFFTDKANGSRVVFSTIHKSKGMEADRVFILRPDKLPLIFPGRLEASNQEQNLDYVARTRAKTELIYLCNEDFPMPSPSQPVLDGLETKELPRVEIEAPRLLAVSEMPDYAESMFAPDIEEFCSLVHLRNMRLYGTDPVPTLPELVEYAWTLVDKLGSAGYALRIGWRAAVMAYGHDEPDGTQMADSVEARYGVLGTGRDWYEAYLETRTEWIVYVAICDASQNDYQLLGVYQSPKAAASSARQLFENMMQNVRCSVGKDGNCNEFGDTYRLEVTGDNATMLHGTVPRLYTFNLIPFAVQ